MKIDRRLQPLRPSFKEFAEAEDLTLCIRERRHDLVAAGMSRFFVYLARTHLLDRGVVHGMSAHGNGETEAEAICDYVSKIAGRTLIIDMDTNEEKRIPVPFFDGIWSSTTKVSST